MKHACLAALCVIVLSCSEDSKSDDDPGPTNGGAADSGAAGACSGLDMASGAALHQAALEVLTPMTPCGFSSCHSGRGKAGLSLAGSMDLRALLVGKAACEAPALSLVDGSGGEAALQKSWLWIKLTSPADAQGALPTNASWGASVSCGQTPDQPYGSLMPLESERLDEARLSSIRKWICAGAPGP